MKTIYIPESKFSDDQITKFINQIINIKETTESELKNLFINGVLIGGVMPFISTEKALCNIIQLLRKNNFPEYPEYLKELSKDLNNDPEIDTYDAVRIRAMCHGLSLILESFKNNFDFPENVNLPQLEFKIAKNAVITNIEEVIEEISGNNLKHILKSIGMPPKENQLESYKKTLREMGNIRIEYNPGEFKKHIEHMTVLKENAPNEGNSETPTGSLNFHPRIFPCPNAFKLFEAFKENIVKNELADYSFIYRKMVEDELMHNIKDTEYRVWLLATYDIDIANTKQLQRCKTTHKLNLYKALKSENKPYNIHN